MGRPQLVALQTIGSQPAVVLATLANAQGRALGAVNLSLPTNRYRVDELIELFQMPIPEGGSIRLSSTTPIQATGIAVDAAGTPRPVLPR